MTECMKCDLLKTNKDKNHALILASYIHKEF